jgi:hypothetical protein
MEIETLEGSGQTFRSQLNIFALPPSDVSITQSMYYTFTPIGSIKEFYTPILFYIPPTGSQYIDPHTSFLYLKVKLLVQDDRKLEDGDSVCPSNLFFYTIFKSFMLTINGTVVDDSHFYGYKSVIEKTLLNGPGEKQTRLTNVLYFKNTGINEWDPAKNPGFKSRVEIAKGSKVFELLGPINSALCNQSK